MSSLPVDKVIPKSMLYTKTGDDCTSSLYTGERRRKTDQTFEALGHIDELNSTLGLVHHFCKEENNGLAATIAELQSCLMELMSHVATPAFLDENEDPDQEKMEQTAFDEHGSALASLEIAIDDLDFQLPALTQFILPSGGLASCQLHIARSVCRRAERSLVPLRLSGHVHENAYNFMNRLSDFFFAAARFSAMTTGQMETTFKASAKVPLPQGTRRFTVPQVEWHDATASTTPAVISTNHRGSLTLWAAATSLFLGPILATLR
eukprot:m.836834 g.836834  ORF g.836834 m.836834 type:complete len:264 (-) comp23459_c0_seq8:2133-2924(-)